MEEKNQVEKFYNAKIQELDKAQKLICREATIQVALQLTLILYQEILIKSSLKKSLMTLDLILENLNDIRRINEFVHFPVIEFQFSELSLRLVSPTFLWVSGFILQTVTTLSSAYSTFKVIIDRLFIYKIKVSKRHQDNST